MVVPLPAGPDGMGYCIAGQDLSTMQSSQSGSTLLAYVV